MTLRREFDLTAGFQAVASPACFAAATSGGRWQLARHLAVIDRAVLDTLRGRSPSILIVEAPPRHGKSELISKYLPAWFLGAFPQRRVMLAAYGAGFARTWGRKARELLEEHGRELFGVEVRRDVRAASEWGLQGFEGGMVTSGVGGPLTGRGADLLIVDDPVKNSEQAHSQRIREMHWDWWQSTASTRIEPNGCAILVGTRWHEDDLSGRLIRAAEARSGLPARRVRLPALAESGDLLGRAPGEALWPERWNRIYLEARHRAMPSDWWLALFQQRPGRDPDLSWPEGYFGPRIWAPRWPDAFETSVLAVDPAMGRTGGDLSAMVFVGVSGGLYWIDASIARRPPEVLIDEAVRFADLHRPHVVVMESNMFQELLVGEFMRQSQRLGRVPCPVVPVFNGDPKDVRIKRLGYFLHPQLLRFRDSSGAHELVRELREHPKGDHDDGPDALELALRWLRQDGRAPSVLDVDVEFAQA